mgnify:CR=1 FL=1
MKEKIKSPSVKAVILNCIAEHRLEIDLVVKEKHNPKEKGWG